jgi:hypothetical protein
MKMERDRVSRVVCQGRGGLRAPRLLLLERMTASRRPRPRQTCFDVAPGKVEAKPIVLRAWHAGSQTGMAG